MKTRPGFYYKKKSIRAIFLTVIIVVISPFYAAADNRLILPEDLEYRGAFRLPDVGGDCSWEYSGHAMTFYPKGDPKGKKDYYPGSIFATGNDAVCQFVSEISIPEPRISRNKNLKKLNTAKTLQKFQDIRGGLFGDFQGMTIPRVGLEYLPARGNQKSGKLHFCWAQHIQAFEASHGWCELNLSKPRTKGPWIINKYSNYVTNDYIFEIPESWADINLPGYSLATGRAREGLWSGRGPGLFAYRPSSNGKPPAPNTTIKSVRPLLLYGKQTPGIPEISSNKTQSIPGYSDADHWYGGAWLTSGNKAALMFAGTKALGKTWYGYADGLVHEHDCYEANTPPCPKTPEWPYDNRGFWAQKYQAQIIFYKPDDIAKVVAGKMKTWEPKPYAVMKLDSFLFDPYTPNHPKKIKNHLIRYKRDYVGAVCFDRKNGLLYVSEKQADGEKSLIHVWKIKH